MSTKDFSTKINEFQNELDSIEKQLTRKDSHLNIMMGISLSTPVILLLGLYIIKPKMIMKEEGEDMVRDNSKMLQWVIIGSLLVWICLYIYYFCVLNKKN